MTEEKRAAENFRRIRKSLGLTQEQVAALAKVTPGYVGQIEVALAPLGKRARAKWAKLFNVDISEFLKKINVEEDKLAAELERLKREAEQYGIENVRRIIKIMPILFEKGSNKK